MKRKFNLNTVEKVVWRTVGVILGLIVLAVYTVIGHALYIIWFRGGI